jgi:hypothetical protein
VRTISKEAPTEFELETLDLVHRVVNTPGFARLGERVEKLREQYFANLAKGLATNPKPLDQREIDYKRGFWQGALYATQRLPKTLAKDWEAVVAEANKEAGEDTV